MSAIDRAFVWLGGALFVSSLAFCAWWYLVPLGGRRAVAGPSALLADVLIFSVFALHHSVFARDAIKARLTRLVADPIIRPMYVWTASVLFIMVFVLWRPIGGTVYEV